MKKEDDFSSSFVLRCRTGLNISEILHLPVRQIRIVGVSRVAHIGGIAAHSGALTSPFWPLLPFSALTSGLIAG